VATYDTTLIGVNLAPGAGSNVLSGSSWVALLEVINRSANPVNVAHPDVGQPINVNSAGAASGGAVTMSRLAALRLGLNNGVVTVGFLVFSGGIYTAVHIVIQAVYRSSDKLTLVGTVFNQAGVRLPNVRLHFQATQLVNTFYATRADVNGVYIVFLDANVAVTVAGSNEDTCQVFQLVQFNTFPDHTDIILKVPDACVVPVPIVGAGENLDDILNKEIGFHSYEPIKTAAVTRPTDPYVLEQVAGGVTVAIGADQLVLDTVLLGNVALDSIPVGADGDVEFRFSINGIEPVPRAILNTANPQADLLSGKGVLYAAVGQHLQVFARNLTAGSTVSSVTARASILGRNA
jgi:hypothetical protein